MLGGRPSISGTSANWKYLTMDDAIPIKRMYMVVYYGDGTETTFGGHHAIVGTPDGSWRLTGRSGDHRVFDATRDTQNFDNGGTTYRNGSTVDSTYQENGLPIIGELFTITSPEARTGQWRLLGNNATWTGWEGGLGEIIFTDGTENLETQQMIEGYLAHKWGLTLEEGHPYEEVAPGAPVAVASLAGSVTDPEDDALTILWTKESGPDALVNFGDPADPETTVTFSAEGVYTLRLTANDGFGESYDECIITVGTITAYTVTYDGNQSTGGDVPVDANSYTNGAIVTVLDNTNGLVKTGHTFSGWNTQADGEGTPYAPDATFTINANTTLYAQWTPNDYTVTFQPGDHGSLEGGDPNVVHIVAYGSAAPEAPTVTPDAEYDFTGWNPTLLATITNNFTTTAQYALKTYTLTVNSGSGAGSYPAGTVVDVEANAPASGYEFDVWTGDTAHLANAASASTTFTMPGANATITATYRLLTYNVSYDGNEPDSGTAPENQIKTYGVDLTLASNTGDLARVGYTFSGWNTEVDGSGADYAEGVTYTDNASLELYAKWTLNQYTVTFETDGTAGATLTGNTNQVINHGANGIAVTANAPAGYQFVNWTHDDVQYSDEATVTPVTVTDDMTLVANFIDNETIAITAASAEKIYDGLPLTTNDFSYTGVLAEGHTLSVTVTGSLTQAGVGANVPTNAIIRDASDNDVTDTYNITYFSGTLTVTQRPLTITADSDSKVYDGTPLTAAGHEITAGSLADDDSLDSVTLTGSQTNAGESDNEPSAAVITNAGAENVTASYDITYANGTLTVTPKHASTLTVEDVGPFVYNGAEQTPEPLVQDGATVLVRNTDYTLSYLNNVNAGVATVTVTGIGNYTGTQNKNFTIAKETPTVSVWPTASAILLGDPLSASELSGGAASVDGAFDFTNPSTVPSEGGDYPASVTFTPTETANYDTVTDTVNVWVEAPVTLPFEEDFEGLDLGDLDGQNKWQAFGVDVQTNVVYAGTQAAQIVDGDGFMLQEFEGAETNVWTDFYIQPVLFEEDLSVIDPTATAVLYFNADGHPVVYDGEHAEVIDTFTATGQWVRVTMHHDYDAQIWDLYLDEVPVRAGLGFYNTSLTHHTEFEVSGAGSASAYVDDILIDVESPFALPIYYTLAVHSAHGDPTPGVGTNSFVANALIHASLPVSLIEEGLTQYEFTNWVRTGSSPATGTLTNMSFNLTEDTTIEWQWGTNYWVELKVEGE